MSFFGGAACGCQLVNGGVCKSIRNETSRPLMQEQNLSCLSATRAWEVSFSDYSSLSFLGYMQSELSVCLASTKTIWEGWPPELNPQSIQKLYAPRAFRAALLERFLGDLLEWLFSQGMCLLGMWVEWNGMVKLGVASDHGKTITWQQLSRLHAAGAVCAHRVYHRDNCDCPSFALHVCSVPSCFREALLLLCLDPSHASLLARFSQILLRSSWLRWR